MLDREQKFGRELGEERDEKNADYPRRRPVKVIGVSLPLAVRAEGDETRREVSRLANRVDGGQGLRRVQAQIVTADETFPRSQCGYSRQIIGRHFLRERRRVVDGGRLITAAMPIEKRPYLVQGRLDHERSPPARPVPR